MRIGHALALGALLALPGFAAAQLTTEHLDPVEDEVVLRDGLLTGDLDKAGKKVKKAYAKVIKTFAKESPDLGGDLKIAQKVVKTLQKALPEDGAIEGLLEDAVDGFQGEVDQTLDDLDEDLSLLPDSKFVTKGDRFVEQGRESAGQAAEESDLFLRLKALFKATQKAKSARKAADKAEGGGGGGGGGEGSCIGRAFTSAEFAQATVDARSVPFDRVEATAAKTGETVDSYTITFCVSTTGEAVTFTIAGAPAVGTYDLQFLSPGGSIGYRAPPSPATGFFLIGGGTVMITSGDGVTAALVGTFAMDAGETSISGSFHVETIQNLP